jgi:hypothetical protein
MLFNQINTFIDFFISQTRSQTIKSQLLSTVKFISGNNSKREKTNRKKRKDSVFFLV